MDMVAKQMDWRQLYILASRQAILGFCFDGIERLGKDYPEALKINPIEQDLLIAWMGMAQQIRRQNMRVNMVACKLYSTLKKDGLSCCILKGQGNALMYKPEFGIRNLNNYLLSPLECMDTTHLSSTQIE